MKIGEMGKLRKAYSLETKIRYRSHILVADIEDLNQDCVKILRFYLYYFLINKPLAIKLFLKLSWQFFVSEIFKGFKLF